MYQKLPQLFSFLIIFPVALPAYGQSSKGKPIEIAVLDNRGNTFQNRDWLKNWLSGPLPGQPETSRKPMQDGPISQPVPRSQKAVPNRSPDTGIPPELPPLKETKPFNHQYRRASLPSLYLGVGLVATSGTTTWNHDATSSSASLGNPSSELTYEKVGNLALEFNGGMKLADTIFVRGNLGVGVGIGNNANFRDDDFLAGQSLFSSTDSVVPDSSLFYLTIDAGKEVINIGDGDITMSLFAGYQYWTENYRAYGAFNRLTNSTSVSDNIAVIENLVEWNSIRLGAVSTYRPNDQLEWVFDFALIPYTSMYNEDSHLLRTSAADLGAAPNIVMEGSGFGYELALGMTYSVTPRISAVLDFRYWALMSEGDVTFGPNTTSPSVFPLNDLDSFRYGINGGVRYSF